MDEDEFFDFCRRRAESRDFFSVTRWYSATGEFEVRFHGPKENNHIAVKLHDDKIVARCYYTYDKMGQLKSKNKYSLFEKGDFKKLDGTSKKNLKEIVDWCFERLKELKKYQSEDTSKESLHRLEDENE